MRNAPSTRRRTAARVAGSIGVVGVAAAVAGLGTFGTFTDSTTPVDTTVKTGVLSIALSPAAAATVPALAGGWLPGDSYTRPIDLVNDGSTPYSSVSLRSVATVSSVLDTDAENGLQLEVRSCSKAWDVVGAGYACSGDVTDFYAGRVVMDEVLQGAATLTPGGVDHLLVTAFLPGTAGDGFQRASSDLSFVFTATQRDGAAR
ncbi:TasA family protein [Geodermatophilus sp. CPCC 206100]|uniref:TasA family protein n=1 Tax=Geodermatophilus sp. CPCC 206100 TaxID=3020054 RepID=UPI003B008F80